MDTRHEAIVSYRPDCSPNTHHYGMSVCRPTTILARDGFHRDSKVIFDKEEWVIQGRDRLLEYPSMSGEVAIYPGRGGAYYVCIAPPIAALPLGHQLSDLPIAEYVEQLRLSPISFFLYQDGRVWVFGMSMLESTYDLWAYRTLPAWARR